MNIANRQLVKTILAMNKGLNLKTVAEGVESIEQISLLKET